MSLKIEFARTMSVTAGHVGSVASLSFARFVFQSGRELQNR